MVVNGYRPCAPVLEVNAANPKLRLQVRRSQSTSFANQHLGIVNGAQIQRCFPVRANEHYVAPAARGRGAILRFSRTRRRNCHFLDDHAGNRLIGSVGQHELNFTSAVLKTHNMDWGALLVRPVEGPWRIESQLDHRRSKGTGARHAHGREQKRNSRNAMFANDVCQPGTPSSVKSQYKHN